MKQKLNFREIQEQREKEWLSPRAALAAESNQRLYSEKESDFRTCFQTDCDRILYSKAFRRLMHKTQVFIAPEGDHYRTRLTHTLEVSQISRNISRVLNLNEDLTESVALGHDLGHSPFGHAGELALNQLLQTFAPGERFLHQEHSLRVVDLLEQPGGLNLTLKTRDGILCHSKGRATLSGHEEPDNPKLPVSLEGQVVRIADRMAYLNHDLDDALRAGIIKENRLPKGVVKLLGNSTSKRITNMINDVIKNSRESKTIRMSKDFATASEELKEFLWDNVYIDSAAKQEEAKSQKMLGFLFHHFMDHPELIPKIFFSATGSKPEDPVQRARAVCDYIAGMSDRYALFLFERIFVPKFWQHT